LHAPRQLLVDGSVLILELGAYLRTAAGVLRLPGERLMQKQQRKLQSFGDDDRPSCPNCGKLTALTKRPDPDYNLRYLRYERRVFTCPACGQQTERIVEVAG
jgi:predicted RNA-binding Zn-ribbon protein involved in translation (DUF1610 family)